MLPMESLMALAASTSFSLGMMPASQAPRTVCMSPSVPVMPSATVEARLLEGEDHGLGQADGAADGAVLGAACLGAHVGADALCIGLGVGGLDGCHVVLGHEELQVRQGLGADGVGRRALYASLLDAHVHDLAHVGGQREVRVAADDDERHGAHQRKHVVLKKLDDSHAAGLPSSLGLVCRRPAGRARLPSMVWFTRRRIRSISRVSFSPSWARKSLASSSNSALWRLSSARPASVRLTVTRRRSAWECSR